MKRFVVILFAFITLCSSTACNNNQNPVGDQYEDDHIVSEYIGEWKANAVSSRFDDEITYRVSTITFEKDGTCSYEGRSATWEYIDELKQIVFTLDDSNVSGVLKIEEEAGKMVLKYFSTSKFADRTYYRPQDFEEKDKAYVGKDGEVYDTPQTVS